MRIFRPQRAVCMLSKTSYLLWGQTGKPAEKNRRRTAATQVLYMSFWHSLVCATGSHFVVVVVCEFVGRWGACGLQLTHVCVFECVYVSFNGLRTISPAKIMYDFIPFCTSKFVNIFRKVSSLLIILYSKTPQ